MRAFKKTWKVNASLPDVIFCAGLEQGGLGTPKARAIITCQTISLLNQCMRLNDDLRQVTIQDILQAIAYLGYSTIAEAQAEIPKSVVTGAMYGTGTTRRQECAKADAAKRKRDAGPDILNPQIRALEAMD